MAKVTIHTKSGETIKLEVSPDEESFYDDLPFNSENVICTEIKG